MKTSPWCANPAMRYVSIAMVPTPRPARMRRAIEAHSHHKAGSTGNECIACHMPKIAQTIADQNVRSHTFHFVTPSDTETLKIPNACNVCHTDKSIEWAKSALESWPDRSPWRMSR